MIIVIGLVLLTSLVPPGHGIFQESATAQQSTVYVCPMHAEVQSSTPGKCPKCDMELVIESPRKDAEEQEEADTYTCPMHPEIRTGTAGKCSKCGMSLVPTLPGISEYFDLRLDLEPAVPKPNEKVKLTFRISNPRDGEPISRFALLHDEFFHLFIVSQDLTHFQHIHPRLQRDGSFVVETVLPYAGRYKVYSDFYPVEGTPQVIQRSIVTSGYRSDLFATEPALQPDTSLTRVVEAVPIPYEDGPKVGVDIKALPPGKVNPIKVELTLEPSDIIAGRPTTLKYRLSDAQTGEPVRDLIPYLAAWGHTLILSEDQSDYVHSHPDEAVPETSDRLKLRGGPDVTFEALFPRPGVYRIWTQFLRGCALATVSFTVRAKRLG